MPTIVGLGTSLLTERTCTWFHLDRTCDLHYVGARARLHLSLKTLQGEGCYAVFLDAL